MNVRIFGQQGWVKASKEGRKAFAIFTITSLLAMSAPAGFVAEAVVPSTTIYLTSTGAHTWTVPADWNSANNTIEVIGGGGSGATNSDGGGGGGGGGYSIVSNLSLTPSGSINYTVGSVAGDTWFNAASCASSSACAKGGASASGITHGAGGSTTGAVGTTKRAGGAGFDGDHSKKGGGGGGAAGKNAGGNSATSATGGRGDGTFGGLGGTGGTTSGNPGGNGTEYDSTHGSGGGGEGTGGGNNQTGGAGGLYGAGGGGGRGSSGAGGAGKQGLIVVTYTPAPTTATVTLVKTITNDNGGTALATAWTLTATGPTTISGATGSGTVTNATVTQGTYALSENGGSAGYAASQYSCVKNAGSPVISNSITLAGGDTATCTINNNDNAAHLIVIKHVVNDNRGTSVSGDFTMQINGVTVQGGNSFAGVDETGVDKTLTTIGQYSVSESGPSGYNESDSTDCSGTIALGETKTCTITNDDKVPGVIHVIKHVINNEPEGYTGTASAGDFTLTVHGGHPNPASVTGSETGVDVTIDAGAAYSVSESGPTSGYATSQTESCSGTMPENGNVTCTVTNNDNPATTGGLTVVKVVDNGNGGTAIVSDFHLHITKGETVTDVTSGQSNQFAGDGYTVSETYNSSQYTQSFSESCANGSVTVVNGQSVTCTITNTAIAPKLTLVKHVVNTDGEMTVGTSTADAWTLSANGTTTISGVTGSDAVTNASVHAGTYALSESAGPEGYTPNETWSCVVNNGGAVNENSVVLGLGDVATCTMINTAQPVHLIIVKKTDNGSGDNTFNFQVTNGETFNQSASISTDGGVGTTSLDIPAGSFDVNEINLPQGWHFASATCVYENQDIGESIAGGDHITVANGDSVTCTFHNTTQTADITRPVSSFTSGDTQAHQIDNHLVVTTDISPMTFSGQSTDAQSGVASANMEIYKMADETAVRDAGFQTVETGPFVAMNCSNIPVENVPIEIVALSLTGTNPATWSHTWTPPAPGAYCVQVHATDVAGNVEHTAIAGPIAIIPPVPSALPQCSDGIDNNGDGLIDMADPGCADPSDGDEGIAPPSNGGGGGGGSNGPISTAQPTSGSGQVLGASTFAPIPGEQCSEFIHSFMSLNRHNDSDQVNRLQQILISQGYSVVLNGIFDKATAEAVKAFQKKYGAQILAPWGIGEPTGFVYLTTRKELNEIFCKATGQIFPLTGEEQSIIDNYKKGGHSQGSTVGSAVNATAPAGSAASGAGTPDTSASTGSTPTVDSQVGAAAGAANNGGFWGKVKSFLGF